MRPRAKRRHEVEASVCPALETGACNGVLLETDPFRTPSLVPRDAVRSLLIRTRAE